MQDLLGLNINQVISKMYLETVYILSQTKSVVRAIDVGAHMVFSKPSVSRVLGLLKNGGYIAVQENGGILLTESGRKIAERIFERHTVLTAVLTRLGVPPEIAAADACKMEHDISEETFAALKRHIEQFSATS